MNGHDFTDCIHKLIAKGLDPDAAVAMMKVPNAGLQHRRPVDCLHSEVVRVINQLPSLKGDDHEIATAKLPFGKGSRNPKAGS